MCGCTLPYLACFIAVAAMAVASGMWHAAGRAARVTTAGQVTSTSTDLDQLTVLLDVGQNLPSQSKCSGPAGLDVP